MNETIFTKLNKSAFRSKFYLKDKDIAYINQKGFVTIKEHAQTFINKRLANKNPINDGKQTPWQGHPVFIAQHATATCCRKCLEKWHHIPQNKELTKEEQEYIVNIIMTWLKKEYQNNHS